MEKNLCVGEKTKRLEIFLNINKRGGSNNAVRVENFLKINKQVYPSFRDLRIDSFR